MADAESHQVVFKQKSAQDHVCFYAKTMPEIGDLVMVKITQVNETSAYVHLLEYDNIEGMIPYTELSRRRIRSIAKLVKLGKLEVAQVLRLDKAKGYIDLSKKAVTSEEKHRCEDRFNKAKVVHSMMRHAATSLNIPLMEIQETVTWPLYKKFGHAHDALKLAVAKPEEVFQGLAIRPELRDFLEKLVKLKLKPQPFRLRADVNVTNFKRAGIDAIKEVLRIGILEGANEPKMDVKITIVSPPQYCVRTQTENKEEGLLKLKTVIEKMTAAMKERQGSVEVTNEPRVVGEDGEDIQATEDQAAKDSSSSGEEDDE
jgi:translation initiation factor 2 subunit 1